ncbi:MAG: alpha/beta hydrolase [Hyphomicrobiales bacterium]
MATPEPGMIAFMAESAQFFPQSITGHSVDEHRACYAKLCDHFNFPHPNGLITKDFTHEDVPLRLYTPADNKPGCLILYLHGGGWVIGNLESHDSICAELANQANAQVLAVDYRLAPEHPFPAGFEDCVKAFNWARANANHLIVAGDSAGSCLAAAIAHYARDQKINQIVGQVHIYPTYAATPDGGTFEEFAEAPGLSLSDIHYSLNAYLGKEGGSSWSNPYARPIIDENFSNLPPAYIHAAEVDPLRDEAFAYQAAMKNAGGEAELRVGKGLIHGFLRGRFISNVAGEAFRDICTATASFFR